MRLMSTEELLAYNVPIRDVVFPVQNITPEHQIIGTCFSVSSCGIYVTAAHIFKPFQEVKSERKKPEILQRPIDYNIDDLNNLQVGIFRIIEDEKDKTKLVGKLLPVDGLSIFFDHDIAFLVIADENTSKFPHPLPIPIMEFPKKGMSVRIIGCPKDGHYKKDSKIGFAYVESEGAIIEEYPEKRDDGMFWFPCFETSSAMGPGHSGGPALSATSYNVMGINSGSLDPDYSIISWIGKALDLEFSMPGLRITLLTGERIALQDISLRKLANYGLAKII